MSRFLLSCAMGAFLLTACGGSSSDSNTTASNDTPDIMEPVATTPTAVASSAITAITEGGPITVTAEGSSDPEGDSLSFTWTQIEGPEIVPGGTIMATNLTVTSPDVTEDTVLTFQLTASDGTSSDTDTVSVTVEPLETGTLVSPTTASENFRLRGLTQSATGGYTLFWERFDSGFLTEGFSTQDFTPDGELSGPEILGEVNFDPVVLPNGAFSPIVGAIRSGDTLYHPILVIRGGSDPSISGTTRGPLDGEVLAPADIISTDGGTNCAATIGENQLLCSGSAIDFDDTGAFPPLDLVTLSAQVVQPNGSVLSNFTIASDLLLTNETSTNDEFAFDIFSGLGIDATSDDTIVTAYENISPIAPSPIIFSSFTSAGTPLVDNLTVFSSTSQEIEDITLTVLDNDTVFIVWSQETGEDVPIFEPGETTPDGFVAGSVIMGVIVNADGTSVTEPFRVNIDEDGSHTEPTIESLPNGDAIIGWFDLNEGLLARVIGPTGSPVTGEFIIRSEDELDTDDILTTVLPDGQVIIAIDEEIIAFSPVGR